MDKDEVISTLNDLIETSKEGEKGFQVCAEDVKDAELKRFFSERAQSCRTAAGELQSLVQDFGGKPETQGGIGGALHRRWVDLRSMLSGSDEEAVLEECERGEDIAVSSYRSALDKELPPQTREIVERQFEGVLRNHDRVKALRDRYRAA